MMHRPASCHTSSAGHRAESNPHRNKLLDFNIKHPDTVYKARPFSFRHMVRANDPVHVILYSITMYAHVTFVCSFSAQICSFRISLCHTNPSPHVREIQSSSTAGTHMHMCLLETPIAPYAGSVYLIAPMGQPIFLNAERQTCQMGPNARL
ncbi:uncharacterized protein BCR38DRAFT_32414 [Pseudomassariella vexata]|uniref:Uncharacterized protein n=1 Tax=Pseudomassariella vexata TaxID=1141098 RepID=A0A1Y2DQ48_9PEZI|nr:uncharacterized protein BCR38DRAFT_32414 [Pseudomassariella vexata]ORY61337.1 hypothetical protein BCR38DRAFT_32414 [Pseudomassariella vexata]